MKIAFITTVRHNVGDDFVREGLKHLLRNHFKGKQITFTHIHKHIPATTRSGFANLRSLLWSERIEKYLPIIPALDKVMTADILVQSGAPVYWYHKGHSDSSTGIEWYDPLINKRFKLKKNGVLANIAAGTCQRYDSDASEFLESEAVCNFVKGFESLSQVTTLRDELSGVLFKSLGMEAPVIPCSSIFAIDEHQIAPREGSYVVMNYMKGGAHYAFQNDIDFDGWEQSFKTCYETVKQKERVILSCHNQKEVDEARELDPNAEIFIDPDYREYLKLYAGAKYGIMNRVHAGFTLASLGKPTIVIGNDSRALMTELVGVKNYFVNDVSAELLLSEAERLEQEISSFPEVIKGIKQKAFDDYMKAFANFNV